METELTSHLIPPLQHGASRDIYGGWVATSKGKEVVCKQWVPGWPGQGAAAEMGASVSIGLHFGGGVR